jgi:hypothetical protein
MGLRSRVVLLMAVAASSGLVATAAWRVDAKDVGIASVRLPDQL